MIRPIDLQSTILAGANNPAAQRTDQANRIEAQAAQAAFAAELEREVEAVAAPTEVEGGRIGAKEEREHPAGHERKHATGASFGASFEEVVDEAAARSEEPAHLIDFTA